MMTPTELARDGDADEILDEIRRWLFGGRPEMPADATSAIRQTIAEVIERAERRGLARAVETLEG